MSEANSGKTAAIIGYITIVGCLIAITMNMEPKNSFARFHIRQAFGIHVFFHALAIVFTFMGVVYAPFVLYILYLILLVSGFVQASNAKTKPLPFFGDHFQKWFTFIA